MIKHLTLTLALLCLTTLVFAQVSGTITDAKDNSPVPGVSIVIKGTSDGTISDENGRFTLLNAKPENVLTISYVGYATQEVVVAGTELNIALKEDAVSLNEVVVTALGISKQARSLGYSTQTVNNSLITNSQDANLVNNLQGKVAGVTITNGGAGVGSTSRIVIRGVNSFSSSNQPLFVVDGVPINNETTFNNTINNNPTSNTGVWEEVDWGNGAAEFNAADAESMTVLKGAAAAALYGIRAANGAIVITTKKYDSKEKGKWHGEISTQETVNTALVMPKIQNEYGQGTGSAAFKYVSGSGATENNIPNWGAKFNPNTLVPQFNSPVLDGNGTVIPGLQAADVFDATAGNAAGYQALYPGIHIQPTPWVGHSDNYKNFMQTGANSINNISLGTTTDNGSYRFSFGTLNNKGVFPNTDLNRYQFSVRAETRLSEKLKTNYYLGYVNSSSGNRPNTGYGSESIMYTFFGVAGMPEDIDIRSMKNKYWTVGHDGSQQFRYWDNHDNPYVTMFENTNSFKKNRLIGNASIKYDFSPEWNLQVRSGIDYYNDHREGHRVFTSVRFPTGGFRTDDVTYLENNTDFLLNYTRKPSDVWNFNISLGGNRFTQSTYYIANVANSLIVPGLWNFSNAASILNPYEQKLNKLIYSGYAFGEVSYKNWLFLNLTARNDVSSTLPKGKNSFLYPSASLSAVLSDVIHLPKAISFLKLRASYAQVGRDASPYSISNTYLPNTPFNGSAMTYGNSTLANSNLKPSISSMAEYGIDIRFLENRIGLDFAYYNSDTRNEIVQLPVPASSGYSASYVNGGSISSKGFEFVLSATPIKSTKKGGFNWDMNFNFTHYMSTVTALPVGVDSYNYFNLSQYGRTPRQINYFAQVGQRLGNMYGNKFIRDAKGDIIYSDGTNPVNGYVNGHAVNNAPATPKGTPEYTQTNDQLLGNYNPNFILTWSNTLSYKNFNFNMLWDWHSGGVIYSYTRLGLLLNGMSPETLYRGDNYDATTNTGTIVGKGVNADGTSNATAVPFYTYYNNYYNAVNHEPEVMSASYLKLREIKLGYTFHNIIKNNPSSSINFSLIGRNMFLVTPAKDIDPETLALRGQTIMPGVEFNNLPSLRQYGFSLSFKY